MVGLEKFAFDLVTGLVVGVIQQGTTYAGLSFFEHRRIKNRIDDAIAEVVEPLLPFLAGENIPEEKQRRLIQTCIDELQPLTENPSRLFQGSLNGQIIFDELYADRDLPEVVIEDEVKDIYILLCQRVATILCKIPAAVKDWEHEAWSESYRRLDEIKVQLQSLFKTVDEFAALPSQQADEVLVRVRRQVNQTIRLELDLTGLRADKLLTGKFDNFFVHPEIISITEDHKKHVRETLNSALTQSVHSPRELSTIGTSEESLPQFVHHSQKSILIGLAGAGKSTWAKWLQRETLTDRWTGIGILVMLRELSGEEFPSLQKLVRNTAGRHLAEEITADRIGHWLDAKQIVFILDGFDEIRPAERDAVYDWIVGLQSAARGCPFVLTSRPLTTDHLDRLVGGGWKGWAIELFDEVRIVDYINRWYAHSPKLEDGTHRVDAKMLAQSWLDDPTIEPLTENPLLLSTLLMVYHLGGSLPSGRSQLYRRYVEGMLGLWDDRRGVLASGIQLSLEQKLYIIRGFALKLFFEEQDQLDEQATLGWLEELLQEMKITYPPDNVLDVLCERSGLIVGPGIYSFAHKSIAEYLVAETIQDGSHYDTSGNRIDRFRLFEHRSEDRWNIVLFLWAGLASTADVESFIEACIKFKDFGLAYGVLDDQYDRIPKRVRRQLLLQSVSADLLLGESTSFWSVSRPVTIAITNFKIPTFDLYSLVPYSRFHRIVDKAVTDGTIVWLDCANGKGNWRDLLWMSFVRQVDDIDAWRACLTSPYPMIGSRTAWSYWIAQYAFRKAIFQETVHVHSILIVYQNACPQVIGLVPIALISIGLELILRKDLQLRLSFTKYITNILEILPSSDKGNIVVEWLFGTCDWVLGRGKEHDQYIGDLLVVFIEEMETLVQEGHIERNETYERAIKYVQELRRRRDALEVSEGSSSPD